MLQFSLGSFTPVADGVYVAVAEPESVNIGLVVGPGGAIVIDTGSAPEQGAQIRAAAEQVAGVAVIGVLVTHAHYDHLNGLPGFAGVPSFGHETVPGPSDSFSLAKVLDAGGRRIEAIHFGRGHTAGDVVAIVPDAGVIFAGDLLESSGPPSFGDDCFIKEWPSAVDGILGLVDEHTVIVPGHGPVMDRLAAFTQRAEISALYGQVEHLIGRGVKQADAYTTGEWPFDEATVTAVLPRLYAEFAASGIVPRTQLPLA